MPPLPPDRRPGPSGLRSVLCLAALACLAALPPAHAATVFSRVGTITHEGLNGNLAAGTFSMRKVVLRQDNGTLISAEDVSVSGADGELDNSQWELRGKVHVEYEGTVLDAEAAAVVFVNGRITTVNVQGAPAQPAQFAHTVKQTGRRSQGRAANISFDAPSGDVRFSNGTWFSDGRFEYADEQILYNVNTTAISDDGNPETPGVLTRSPARDQRVPPPREPDRSTAQ